MRNSLLLLAALVSGCAADPAVPRIIRVPVPVPCSATVPDQPTYADDAAILAMPEYTATLAVWIERRAAIDDAAKVRALLQGCIQ